MNNYLDKKQKDGVETVANNSSSKSATGRSGFYLQDNRPHYLIQKKQAANPAGQQANDIIQKQENKTGLPDQLKSGIENISGLSMNDVQVHYNSDKPAQLNAHAFAQGTHLYAAPGQEKHLPHEAWHVVQQKQGRVKPTLQLKGKLNVNDDPTLEKEADHMGHQALNGATTATQFHSFYTNTSFVAQLLAQEQKTEFIQFVENRIKQMNVKDEAEIARLRTAAEAAAAKPTIDTAKEAMQPFWDSAWALPRALLGDAYLEARKEARPRKPNSSDVRSRDGRINCSVVAAAAVLGITTDQLLKRINPEPEPSGDDDDDLNYAEPVPSNVAFLFGEAKKYTWLGSMKPEYVEKMLGKMADYIQKGNPGNDVAKAEELKKEYMTRLMGLAASNELIQANMAAYVAAQLGEGVRVRKGGSPADMLPIADGIEDMKRSPPGTQFIVFFKGVSGGKLDPHYVYANNKGGNIHFIDFQPFAPGATEVDSHAQTINAPTPAPFAPPTNTEQFTSLCFMAFEVNARHIMSFITIR